jgi:hypothetical protein
MSSKKFQLISKIFISNQYNALMESYLSEYISLNKEINIVHSDQNRVPAETLGCVSRSSTELMHVLTSLFRILDWSSSFLYGIPYLLHTNKWCYL